MVVMLMKRSMKWARLLLLNLANRSGPSRGHPILVPYTRVGEAPVVGKELSHEDLPVVLLLVLLRQVPLGTVDLDELEGYAEFFLWMSSIAWAPRIWKHRAGYGHRLLDLDRMLWRL